MKLKDIKNLKQIKVLGKTYKITWYCDDTPADDGRMGYTDMRTSRIYLYQPLTEDSAAEVLVHEVLHILNETLQVDLAESDMVRLGSGVTAFLLDNSVIY